jgi:hypothetical protein
VLHQCRVGCKKSGGIRFTINGRDYFELVLISNVGGAGDISKVWIKGSKMNKWESMSRNWGVNWQSLSYLNGQSMSFRVQLSNGKTSTTINVPPSSWRFGQSFTSKVQCLQSQGKQIANQIITTKLTLSHEAKQIAAIVEENSKNPMN